mgnify:CR=1 FL=1
MRILILSVAALLSSTAAHADMRATYVDRGEEMVAEVNDDGRARLNSAKPGEYTLVTPQGAFIVFTDDDGQVKAASMADFRAVLNDMMAGMWKSLGVDAPPSEPVADAAAPLFEEAGVATINGREGRAYKDVRKAAEEGAAPGGEDADTLSALLADDEGVEGEPSTLVVSDDPALAPLGRIWAQLATLMPNAGILLGAPTQTETQFAALLDGRGVLKLDTIELKDVTFAPIDDAYFALPAAILSKDEVKAMLEKPAATE